jgi:hypothetical protein
VIKLSSRRAALVLSGSTIALTAAMLPAQAATSGWRINTDFAVRGASSAIFSIDAISAHDAWATGFTVNSTGPRVQSILRHWAGKKWQPAALPAAIARRWRSGRPIFTQVAASSASNVWVISGVASGRYLHLDGKHWSVGSLPGGGTSPGTVLEITAASDLGKNNAWAFGVKLDFTSRTPTAVPYAAHFNGTKWTSQAMPGKGAITAVSVASSASLWAVVGRPDAALSPLPVLITTKPEVLHWTPTGGWQQAAVQPVLPSGANLDSVQARPTGTVWIGGSVKNGDKGTTAFAAKWSATASAWTLAHLGGASSGKWQLIDMAPDGGGGLWGIAIADNVKGEPERLWHGTGSTWSRVMPAFGKHEWLLIQLAAVPGTTSIWGAGLLKNGQAATGFIAIDGPTPR